MIRPCRSLSPAALVLAVITLGAATADARAGWLGYRNDTKGPVIVQGFSMVNRVLRQGKRHTLQPGETAWDLIVTPGNKLIIIVDAKQPTRTLYQDTILIGPAGTQFYAIQSAEEVKPPPSNPSKSTKTQQPVPTKVKLVLENPPPTPPGVSPAAMPRR